MPQQEQAFRPYAAPSNVFAVLQRARTRNLPETINNDFLRISGIPEVVFGRVMQALRFLNLIYEDGRPTDKFQALAGASDAQYKEILEAIVREAYRSDFSMIDPSKDLQSKILDQFRAYQPRSQTMRMVMLFLALCREAGIPVLDAPRQRQMKEVTTRTNKPKPQIKTDNSPQRNGTKKSYKPAIHSPGELLFGITEEDISVLDETEFNEVWTALGKVARARAKAKKQNENQGTQENAVESSE